MVKSISLKILLFLLIITLTTIYSVGSYVLCDDGDTACPESYICCLKNTGGFSCCSNTRICCYGGMSCCTKEKSFNFLLELNEFPSISVGAFSLKNKRSEFIDVNKITNNRKNIKKINSNIKEKFDSANANNAISISAIGNKEIENKQVLDLKTIKNIFEFANSFFEAAEIYKNFDNFSNCKIDFVKIAENGKDIISLIKEFDISRIDPQKITGLLHKFSHLFRFLSNAVLKCQNIKNDFLDLQKKVKDFLANEDLQLKLIGSLIMNEHLIQTINDINEQCGKEDYIQCGKISGELFTLLFYIL